MTDKHNKTKGDEEYQFPQDEYVLGEDEEKSSTSDEHDEHDEPVEDSDTLDSEEDTSHHEEADSSSSKLEGLLERFPLLQNKRVILVVGIALFALIGFKIMRPSHTVKVVKKQPIQAVAPQHGVLSKLDRLSQDAANSQNTVSQLQSQVSDLKASLNTANANGVEMKDAVVALAQQVQDLTNQLKKENAQASHRKKTPPAPMVTFHLVALVPGRAWIMGSNGESDTITVGTKLKHYGIVKAIDIYTGKVLTSSGKTIAYNTEGN